MIFTRHGILNMRNRKWADCFDSLDAGGPSFVDEAYSRAYVRHLVTSGELLGLQICSIHNLAFYLWLVGEARRHIVAGDFAQWKADIIPDLQRRL